MADVAGPPYLRASSSASSCISLNTVCSMPGPLNSTRVCPSTQSLDASCVTSAVNCSGLKNLLEGSNSPVKVTRVHTCPQRLFAIKTKRDSFQDFHRTLSVPAQVKRVCA